MRRWRCCGSWGWLRRSVRQQGEADHLVEQPRPDVRIPLRLPRRDLAQIESDDPLAAAMNRAQKSDRLVPRQAAGDGRAGARAKRRIEAVDVPREIDVLRQLAHDLVRELAPGRAVFF